MNLSGQEVEQTTIDIVKINDAVKFRAVKLSRFSVTWRIYNNLDDAGGTDWCSSTASTNPMTSCFEVRPNVLLSTPQDLRLPLRWIAILYGRIKADMAATSGIHTAEDVIKMLMVGANITMMTSALLRSGIDHLRVVEQNLCNWMEANEYVSVQQMRGSLSQINCADPSAFERAQYMRAVSSLPLHLRG
jgi:dihydroorotate dehydrogenase (fumarate)